MRKFINYQLTFSLLFLTVPILGLDNLKIEQPQVEAFQEELSHLSTEGKGKGLQKSIIVFLSCARKCE